MTQITKHFADCPGGETPTYISDDCMGFATKVFKNASCMKLSPKYIGPFCIKQHINPITSSLDLQIAPPFNVSGHHLRSPSHTHCLQCPLIGQLAYLVKNILDSRCQQGRLEYLVEWAGYRPSEQCTSGVRAGGWTSGLRAVGVVVFRTSSLRAQGGQKTL